VNKKYLPLFLWLSLLVIPVWAQSQQVQEAPWFKDPLWQDPESSSPIDFYLPLEFLGGNPLNFGFGCALLDRSLDLQLQGAFAYYEWDEYASLSDDYDTWGFTLGGDVSHHFTLWNNRLGLYYGAFYRYNYKEETDYSSLGETHWIGLSWGVELHRERLTYYVENLWFLSDFSLDIPYPSFLGGIKLWL
jgi:hypothetical protein